MTKEEKEYHSNLGWLGCIIHKPKNILRVNVVALDRLEKLGYIEKIGSFVVSTNKGKIYYNSIKEKK